MLRELLASVEVEVDPRALLRLPKLAATCARLWDAVREGGLVHAVAGPERKAIIDRLQATMALIEGHAEHVMDAAGAAVLPLAAQAARGARAPPPREARRWSSCSSACSAWTSRCASTCVGKRFCDAVVARRGIEGAQPRLERPGARCRRSPSSTTRPPGCAEHMFVL